MSKDSYQSDFLIIGSGIAGLSLALRLAEFGSVTVISKKNSQDSNTLFAQGGIASVIDKNDSFEAHIQDTLRAGDGLCHEEVVRYIIQKGPKAIEELTNWGVQFSRQKNGNFDLGKEGGHSFQRIIHAKDSTGREIEINLLDEVKKHANISLEHRKTAIDFITEHHLNAPLNENQVTCYGAYVYDRIENSVQIYQAKYSILCSGGAGQVYLHTTNPSIATADGIAMAYRAGCEVENLEFMQFHPTSLYQADRDKSKAAFLISEAVRGFGAVLRKKDGFAFMANYDERKELASRDIVARAIDSEIKKTEDDCVFLDLSHRKKDEIIEHFPMIYEHCKNKLNIDISKDWIPVVPAAHYLCGGVKINLQGRTSISRLYACGEVANSGLHGANRLASNSLLEAIVISANVFRDIKERLEENISFISIPNWDDTGTIDTEEWGLISHDRQSIRRIMWDYVGIVRSDFRLKRALNRINLIVSEIEDYYHKSKIFNDLLELRNMASTAQLIIRSALKRKESRGLHFTVDYPEKSELEKKDSLLRSSLYKKKDE